MISRILKNATQKGGLNLVNSLTRSLTQVNSFTDMKTLTGNSLLRNFGNTTQAKSDKFFFMKDRTGDYKGMRSYYGDFLKKGVSRKRAKRVKSKQFKIKTVSSYMNRVIITGPRHDRKFLHKTQGYNHLRRNKSKASRANQRKLKAFKSCDLYRIKRSLPYWKKTRKLRRYSESELKY